MWTKKAKVRVINKDDQTKEFGQTFSAEEIPESHNDFFIEFMKLDNY